MFCLGESSVNQSLQVGIIGDFNPGSPSHLATTDALSHAAKALSLSLTWAWVPTSSLDDEEGVRALGQYAALWCAPGSPYQSAEGAMRAIQFAREQGRPFIGT